MATHAAVLPLHLKLILLWLEFCLLKPWLGTSEELWSLLVWLVGKWVQKRITCVEILGVVDMFCLDRTFMGGYI